MFLRIPFDLPQADKYRKLLTTRALCSFPLMLDTHKTTGRLILIYMSFKCTVSIGLYDYIYCSRSCWSLPDLKTNLFDIYNPTSGGLRWKSRIFSAKISLIFFISFLFFRTQNMTQARTASQTTVIVLHVYCFP